MSKGGGGGSSLPSNMESAMNTAYSQYNPFSSTFSALGAFNPQAYAGQRVAGLSDMENTAMQQAANLGVQPAYLQDAGTNLSGLMGSGGVNQTALQEQYDLGPLAGGRVATYGLQNAASQSVDPDMLMDAANVGTDFSNLQNLLGAQTDVSSVQDLLGQRADLSGLANASNALTNTSGITNAANQGTNLQGVLDAAQRATDASNIMTAGNRTTDTSGLGGIAGQQNAATSLLSNLASGGTNPYLQTQLNDAISGAVNQASSQYALGGRLGSGSFADALGTGITNAAAPILSQNLQTDQARQLQAAQALGSVSGQDIGRQLQAAETGVSAQQSDIARALQAAQSAAGIQQADLARGLQGQTSAAGMSQADLARALSGQTSAAGMNQADLARAFAGQGQMVDATQAGLGRDANLAGLLTDASRADLGQQGNIAQNIVSGAQTDLARQLQGAGAVADLGTSDLARQAQLLSNVADVSAGNFDRRLQADTTGRQIDATLANQLAGASEADARTRLAAIGMAPGLLGADQSRLNTLAQYGGLQRGIDQAGFDALNAQNAEQNVLDQNRINALLSASGMSSGLYGQAVQNAPPSALSQGIGGAVTGAGLAGMLGINGLSAGMGALAGGGLGLLGLLPMSDRRLKKNIEAVGKHPNGLTMYTWEWNDTAKEAGFDVYPTSGFIAQEAEKIYPEHVFEHESGYLMIDYVTLEGRRSAA